MCLKVAQVTLKSTTAEPFINQGISSFNRNFRQNLTLKGFLKVRHLHDQLQKDRKALTHPEHSLTSNKQSIEAVANG